MKTLSVQIDDHLYEIVLALLREFPDEKVRILPEPEEPSAEMDFEQASDYVLRKNAELYKRLA